jgi:hypothetical protein
LPNEKPDFKTPTLKPRRQTFAKRAFSVAAVYDRRKTPMTARIRRSQSAATGLLDLSTRPVRRNFAKAEVWQTHDTEGVEEHNAQ